MSFLSSHAPICMVRVTYGAFTKAISSEEIDDMHHTLEDIIRVDPKITN
jgi:hypothetical protein